MDLSPNFKKMMGMAEGLKTLPTSAAGPSQKPLPEGIGFDWKPSESETQRDIANAKALEPLERGAFMKARAEELAKTEMRTQPKTQVEKEDAFQSIMDSMLKPIEELGAATRRGFQKIMENQQQTQKALLAAGITPEKISNIGMAVLSTTPTGAVEKWAGEKISTALGDITATPSAKEVGKWQLTFWEGKAGTSNTVSDEVFNTAEEAQKALEKYKKLE